MKLSPFFALLLLAAPSLARAQSDADIPPLPAEPTTVAPVGVLVRWTTLLAKMAAAFVVARLAMEIFWV